MSLFKKIIEDRFKKGPILKRLKEQVFKATTKFLDSKHFDASLSEDINNSQEYVLIFSPYLTYTRVKNFLSWREVKQSIEKGVRFIVAVRPADQVKDQNHVKCIEKLKEAGMEVIEVRRLHFKSVIIDGEVVYIGSINPLSVVDVELIPPDYMLRFHSEALVNEIMESIFQEEEIKKQFT